ncbi:MAG: sugar dehydratase [Rickettsiales bacterium]|nr:sugar dehydratase [Rickettsiales bacterium]|tara:strand:+ start:16542 stop:17516 length:975 start_codon:yes stop_codon:yes gene_type:complete
MGFWQDKKVFVTGASGLVGGWLVKKLIEKGADVVILLRDWVPGSNLIHSQLLHKTSTVRGDLSDPKFLERVLAEYEIECVMHLAAQTIVPIANKNPLSTFESNIAGTWNLLEACRLVSSVKSIVVASSDKAYGDADQLPYKEDMPLNAVYPYDVSKACADMICKSYAESFDLPVSITRCGNFFGGGDLNWNRIVPGTIRSVFRGQRPIIRSDGSLIRDYIYVGDAVSAYMTLGEALFSRPELKGEAFNFSNETQKTTLELTQDILKLMNSTIKPVIEGNNRGEIKAQYLNSEKAQKILNWKPEFGLERGLKQTVSWYQEYFKND